jgi:Uma2 family endonuclease
MAVALHSTDRVTREDYRRLPEGPPYYELIRGELIEMTRPRRAHYRIAGLLYRRLAPHAEDVLGGELAQEPNLYLPGIEDVYHPDLVYVARKQLGICREGGVEGVPDLVCEILSPSTDRYDRGVKMQDFRAAGVPHVWLISPERPVLIEEYVLGEDGLYNLQATAAAPAEWEPLVFPGWRLAVEDLDTAVLPASDEQP